MPSLLQVLSSNRQYQHNLLLRNASALTPPRPPEAKTRHTGRAAIHHIYIHKLSEILEPLKFERHQPTQEKANFASSQLKNGSPMPQVHPEFGLPCKGPCHLLNNPSFLSNKLNYSPNVGICFCSFILNCLIHFLFIIPGTPCTTLLFSSMVSHLKWFLCIHQAILILQKDDPWCTPSP
jgi:hypothetical protein